MDKLDCIYLYGLLSIITVYIIVIVHPIIFKKKENSMLPSDLSSVDLPVLHRYLREEISSLYDCRKHEIKALKFKERAIRVTNEIHRRWLLNE